MYQASIQTFTDLLEKPEFIQWMSGEKPENNVMWEQWLQNNPDKADIFYEAKIAYLKFQEEAIEISEEKILSNIQQALAQAKAKETFRQEKLPISRIWILAACVILLIGIGFAFHQTLVKTDVRVDVISQNPEHIPTSYSFQITNSSAKQKFIHLPDGSSVVLQKNSQLNYNLPFNISKREVYLKGEAFFEITKNLKIPFYVYTNGLVTKVHGTSFRVITNANPDEEVVSVKTGHVTVYAPTTQALAPSISLQPNQQITYLKNQSQFKVSSILKKSIAQLPIEAQVFEYIDTPVKEVFSTLERAYGVQIEYDQEKLDKYSVTASLGDEPLEHKLKWLCSILEGEYVITDEKISITTNSY
jgi:transmembrane sensor